MMDDKTILFEQTPVPKAVMQLAVPTILSSLVMVIYNLADTYFVGMMNNPVQNAAVTLAAPVLLAFNAVNNLFGVGSSSMMSRALGRRDYESVRRSSAFGFYCALFFGLLFSVLCTVGLNPLLILLGADANTMDATAGYLRWTVLLGAAPAILNVVMAYMVRSEGSSLHASIGILFWIPSLFCRGDLIWELQGPDLPRFFPTVLPVSTFLFCCGSGGKQPLSVSIQKSFLFRSTLCWECAAWAYRRQSRIF